MWVPDGGFWLTGDGTYAPTIRELLERLPPGARVRDYFPGGRSVSSEERGYLVHEMRRAADLRPKVYKSRPLTPQARRAQDAKVGRRENNGGLPKKYDHDAVLDLWVAGLSTGDIAARLDMRRVAVAAVVHLARQRGDGRALYNRDPRRLPAVSLGMAVYRRGPVNCAMTRQVTIQLDADQHAAFDAVARKNDVSLSALGRLVVAAALRDPGALDRLVAEARKS